jgi:putative transposase
MDLSRGVYSRDLKIAAMRALDAGSSTGEIARKYQLSPKLLERWRGEWRAKGELAFPGIGRRVAELPVDDARRIAELERKIGQLTMENDFFKKSLAAFQGSSPAGRRQWRGCLFEEVQQAAQAGEAVNALCQMTGLSRAGFYRWRAPRQAMPVEMELRDQMQKVALESPAYGYRRITAELQQRGFSVNHKRVLRMLRQDNCCASAAEPSWSRPTRVTIFRSIQTWPERWTPKRSINFGLPTSPTSVCAPNSCTWPWCWTRSHGA